MKSIKRVLIHLIDMFDIYVIHNVAGWLFEVEGPVGDWVFDTSQKICTKIAESKWWDQENPCECSYCKNMEYTDIEGE